jgi:hypothetical protein
MQWLAKNVHFHYIFTTTILRIIFDCSMIVLLLSFDCLSGIRVSASQTLLTNGFYESVEFGKAAAKIETIY